MSQIKKSHQLISGEKDVTSFVLRAMAGTDDPRLKAIVTSLVTHLHQFVMETRPSEQEFEFGLRWLAALGQHTNESNNEVVLAADVLGISTLVDLINNDGLQGETMSALLGPFYRGDAPVCAAGDCIARAGTPGPRIYFSGRVTGVGGAPIAQANLDVWQASPVGLYENQDASQPDLNLRGKFTTDKEGRFAFTSVRPAGYPVPTNGPVGDLLRAQNRAPMRPAHIHFIVSAPGHKTLITQVFFDHAEALEQDVVFGAKQPLVGGFVEHRAIDPAYPGAEPPFFSATYDFKLVPGTPCFPVPPITGKTR